MDEQHKLLVYLPFIVLAAAVLIAIYHISVFW